jgi:hypothetical protein
MAIAVTVVGLMLAALWAVSQNEFSNVEKTAKADREQSAVYYNTNRDDLIRTTAELKARLTALEGEYTTILSKLAHDPVEDRTFQAVIAAIGKQIDLLQNSINDLNRQMAAALIVIDNNSGVIRKAAPVLPP